MIDNDYREVDTDEKNVSDVEETKEGTPVETGEVVTDDSTEDNEKTDDFDEFCAMCRRPASKAGKLIHVAPNMAICQDCMQKTFDTMGQMPGIPGLGDINIGDMLSSGKMPNIQFVNMSAFTVAENSDFGILRLIVSDTDTAIKVLRDRLYAVSVADVVCLHCPNQPGALAKAMDIITSAGIFIEYMYAFSQGEAANVIIRPDNVEKCAEVLKANKLELIAASDLYKL